MKKSDISNELTFEKLEEIKNLLESSISEKHKNPYLEPWHKVTPSELQPLKKPRISYIPKRVYTKVGIEPNTVYKTEWCYKPFYPDMKKVEATFNALAKPLLKMFEKG